MDWNARWIWESGEAQPRNRYLYFRKVIHLPDSPAYAASARLCADTHYKLYVNGAFVHHGPARSDPRWQAYDAYALGPYLRPGENVVGALVCFHGVGTTFSLVGRGGFLLEAEIRGDESRESEGEGREVLRIGTDETWKVAPAPYLGGYERMSIQLPYPEDFDAAREPVGWNRPGFDDSAWENAVSLGPVGMPPWIRLVPRDIPMQPYHPVLPQRLLPVMVAEAAGEPGKGLTPAETMKQATRLEPAPPESVRPEEGGMFTLAPVRGARGVSLALDFGCEVSGFVQLDVVESGGGRVDIGYAERLEDDGSVNPDQWTGCPVHYADRLRLRPGAQAWESYSPRAFRYLRLDCYDLPQPTRLSVRLNAFAYPVEYRGVFECSDALLNRIWEVGRYTAELCMDDGYMDCPTRERGQWLADARVEALVAAYAFGDTKLARRAWLQFAQSQGVTDSFNSGAPPPPHHHENWIRCLYPSAPPFDTVLPTFNCLWLNGLWDYFMLTGDHSLLTQAWPTVDALLQTLAAYESGNSLLHNLPGWVFVDWARLDLRGEAAGVNAFYYGGLLAAAKIARTVGLPDRGGDLEMHAADVKDALNDLLWDNARGLYADCRVNGVLSEALSEQANILCVLYGIADRAQTGRILETLYGEGESERGDDRVTGRQGDRVTGQAGDPTPDTQNLELTTQHSRLNTHDSTLTTHDYRITRITTPYFAFYLLRALYGLGRHAQALDYMRREWGRMLEWGATTFWEQFAPEWSLCHAWSSAPTYDLPAEVAGIRPTQPGFEEFAVEMQPAGLSWFRAVVPSARGEIAVSYHYRTDHPFVDPMGAVKPLAHTGPAVIVNLTVPPGTRAQVSVPLADLAQPAVRINGVRMTGDGALLPASGCESLRLEGDHLRFAAPPGSYHVEVCRQPADNAR